MKQIIAYLLIVTTYILTQNLQAQNKELFVEYNYTVKGYDNDIKTFEVTTTKNNAISIFKTGLKVRNDEGYELMYIPEDVIFKNYKEQYLISQDKISGKDFYTKEPLNQMQWQLTGNTKTVLKYNCQEATTTFRGRDYVVYFTTELPFKAAPFKFYGLPGVMLQIITKDEQITIEATTLKVQQLTKLLTNPFKDKKTMSWEDFTTFYKKKTEDNQNKIKSEMLQSISEAKKTGHGKEAMLEMRVFAAIGFTENRLELILPENDWAYKQKIIEELKKQN
jgi:GLPGLI family protein